MVTELSPFFGLDRSLDRLMDQFFTPLEYSQRRAAFPPLNLSQDDANVYVQAEIPGACIEDIELTLAESTLSIKGELKKQEGKYYRQERPAGLYQRVVTINSPIDRDRIKASLKDGVLEITLPKSEDLKPRKISIDA